MNLEQQFRERLRSADERLTTSRLSVFRLLLRHAPLSMSSLIYRAKEDGTDPATTYRTLALFQKLGLVQEFGLGRNRLLELSDRYHTHHHHFTCANCGKILDFDNEPIEQELQRAAGQAGFEIRSHQLEATGLCTECRA